MNEGASGGRSDIIKIVAAPVCFRGTRNGVFNRVHCQSDKARRITKSNSILTACSSFGSLTLGKCSFPYKVM